MTPRTPLLEKVVKEGGDEVELIGREGRVGGVVLDQQVSQAVELVGHLGHPLKRLDVGEDGRPQLLANLPDAGKLGSDVSVHMTPTH